MLWKCCTEYVSKFGKLSSGHGTGKGQFSFQSQRKAMPKNVQNTTQLHSSHTLAKWCSKFSKQGFNSMWTMNFQMFKLDLEKAEEPEIKLPISIASSRKQESSRKTSTSALLMTPKPLTVWLTINWKILREVENSSRDGNTTPPDLSPEKPICKSGSNRTGHGTTDWFQIGKGICQGCILSPCLLNFYVEYICQAGWSTSWNQDCWEKYQ